MKSLPSLLYLLLTFYKVLSESDSELELSSAASSESVPSFPAWDVGASEIERAVSKLEPGVATFAQTMSRSVHYREPGEIRKLKCNRIITGSFVRLKPPIDKDAIRYFLLCSQRFGKCLQS